MNNLTYRELVIESITNLLEDSIKNNKVDKEKVKKSVDSFVDLIDQKIWERGDSNYY